MTSPFTGPVGAFETDPGKTKGEIASELYAPGTYDFALPNAWVKRAEQITGEVVPPHFVWLYLPGDLLGVPAPLTTTGVHILMKMARYP